MNKIVLPANVILMYHLAKSNLEASLAGVSAAIAMFLVLFNEYRNLQIFLYAL